MRSMIDIAKKELYRDMPKNGIFVDLIMGSGFESLEMAKYCDKGMVYAFGGGQAIETTCKLFEAVERDNIRLINDTPDNLNIYLVGKINCAICRIHDDTSIPMDKILKAMRFTLNNLKPNAKLLVLMQSRVESVASYIEDLSVREFCTMSISSPNDKSGAICTLVEKF